MIPCAAFFRVRRLVALALAGGFPLAHGWEIEVRPAGDQRIYEVGERVVFHLGVAGAEAAKAEVLVERDGGGVRRDAVPLADGRASLDAGPVAEPGFLRCVATVEIDGIQKSSTTVVGIAPEAIQPRQTEPADFDAFWDQRVRELQMRPATAEVLAGTRQMEGDVQQWEVRISAAEMVYRGRLHAPAGEDRLPGIVCFPDAAGPPGVSARRLAQRGAVVLDLTETAELALPEKSAAERVEAVYLAARMATDALAGLERWNGEQLVVVGGGAGGQLAIVVAALDARVTAVAAARPLGGDGEAGGADTRIGYLDTIAFARRLAVPLHSAWGWRDETWPLRARHALFNAILPPRPKELRVEFELDHRLSDDVIAGIEEWIWAQATAERSPRLKY